MWIKYPKDWTTKAAPYDCLPSEERQYKAPPPRVRTPTDNKKVTPAGEEGKIGAQHLDPADLPDFKIPFVSKLSQGAVLDGPGILSITPIEHGVDPISKVVLVDGREFVFKELKPGSRVYSQGLAFWRLAEFSGWSQLVPEVVWGTLQGKEGMLMDCFKGINVGAGDSVDRSAVRCLKNTPPESFVKAALLDGLACARDRHGNNIMVGRYGDIALIDSTHLFSGKSSRSLFVGTRNASGKAKSLAVLCYKHHVKNGEIGTRYPPKFKELLTKLSEDDTAAISAWLGCELADATALKAQAVKMLSDGFEKSCGVADDGE